MKEQTIYRILDSNFNTFEIVYNDGKIFFTGFDSGGYDVVFVEIQKEQLKNIIKSLLDFICS